MVYNLEWMEYKSFQASGWIMCKMDIILRKTVSSQSGYGSSRSMLGRGLYSLKLISWLIS